MEDLIKALLAAPTNAVLLLAGLAFLAVGVFGRVSERLDPGPKGRIVSGVLGVILVVLGLIFAWQTPAVAPTAGGGKSPPAASTAPAPAVASAPAAAPAGSDYPIALAAGQVVKRSTKTYTILKIELDRHETNELALAFTVRMLNDEPYPTNFWNDNFRLVVDGVPQAPFTTLNEVVDSHAAKEGTVAFAFPANAQNVALQIDKFGADVPGLPIALPAKP